MVQYLSTAGRRKTDPIIWEAVLYYFGSIALNKYAWRKYDNKPIRYYAIIFSGSGSGKNYSMDIVRSLFSLDNYAEAMMSWFLRNASNGEMDKKDKEEIIRYMPKSITVGIEGTAEGLYMVAQSQVSSGFGSLNLESVEFGENITGSAALLSKLKELRDGVMKAKIIKGDDSQEMRRDIEDIISNFIGLGSKKNTTTESRKEFNRIASSGLYRRTFMIDSKQDIAKNDQETNLEPLKEYIDALNEHHRESFLTLIDNNFFGTQEFEYHESYHTKLDEIDDWLINRANDNKLNEYYEYDVGSLDIIEDLAHIIAFLEWDYEVSEYHLEKAFRFFKKTRESVEDIFKSIHPYRIMYNLLKLKPEMTISEMAEIDSEIPIQKTKVKDNLDLLRELCYRNGEVLVENIGAVTRYKIDELPSNDLKHLIFSLSTDNKGKYAINFVPAELTWEQVKQLVVSQKAESFILSHFEPSSKAPDGHRHKDYHIPGGNVVAFDIDEGMTIDEAKEILKEYKYLIYTTKSHQKEKNGVICDRFRIIMPTKTSYFIHAEQYKEFYENVENLIGISSNDPQTRNASRLFFTNPEAEVIENDGTLLDITLCLPNTNKAEAMMPKIDEINQIAEEGGEVERRIAGMMKWTLQNATPGNRNNSLYRFGAFIRDLGLDPESYIVQINEMLSEPLTTKEIRLLTRSVKGSS